jgi:hypothetical protein
MEIFFINGPAFTGNLQGRCQCVKNAEMNGLSRADNAVITEYFLFAGRSRSGGLNKRDPNDICKVAQEKLKRNYSGMNRMWWQRRAGRRDEIEGGLKWGCVG